MPSLPTLVQSGRTKQGPGVDLDKLGRPTSAPIAIAPPNYHPCHRPPKLPKKKKSKKVKRKRITYPTK